MIRSFFQEKSGQEGQFFFGQSDNNKILSLNNNNNNIYLYLECI